MTNTLNVFTISTLITFFFVIRYGMTWPNPVFLFFQYSGQIITTWALIIFCLDLVNRKKGSR
jgi:hypothetical protein